MKDADLRGLVLQRFYDQRHITDHVDMDTFLDIESNRSVVSNICGQLAEHGLIKWHPILGFGGVGSISARGVDVIEGNAVAQIAINVNDHSVSVVNSTNVAFGNGNSQSLNVEKMISAVNNSNVSEAEKQEAKSLIEKIASSPLVQTVLNGMSISG